MLAITLPASYSQPEKEELGSVMARAARRTPEHQSRMKEEQADRAAQRAEAVKSLQNYLFGLKSEFAS